MRAKSIATACALVIGALFGLTASAQTQRAASTGAIAVNGARLAYTIEGTGIPCVVYGIPPFFQRTYSKELRNHLQLIFTDSRMTVPTDSSLDWQKVTMDTLVDDIERLRKALDLDKICVVGNSAFGLIAAEYARRYPAHTSHVVMVGTNPIWPYDSVATSYWETQASADRKQVYAQNEERASSEKTDSLTPSEALIRVLVAEAPKYWYDPRFDCAPVFEGCYWNFPGLMNRFLGEILNGYDITRGAPITTPMFVAHGQCDFDTPHILWDGRKDKFPDLSFNLFEKSGHFPQYDEQTEFDRKLLAWLKSH